VFERKYRKVRREQKTAEFEAHYAPSDTWFDVHADPSEEGLSVYFQEITERKRLEQTLLEIREGERRRIARDLHDVVLQDLAAALQAVQATLVRSREPHEELDQATDTIRRTARSLRGVIHDLRLEEGQPLVKAVEALVADLDQQSECEVDLEVESGFPQELPGEVGIGLLRIVREALANARGHSGARRIVVTLSSEAGWVGIEVLDDGRGFDPATVEGSSFGLWGVEERVRELGAKLEVRSAPGEGTSVSVKAPAVP
jgi:signal transduction histidine kinase